MLFRSLAIFLLAAASLFADPGIQIVPVANTPQPVNAALRIVLPEDGQVIGKNPVWLTLRLRGYALGQDSDFPRKNELPDSKMGQTLHIIVDDKPYFPFNGPAMDPFDVEGDFYQANFRFSLKPLAEGMHTVRVLTCRSYGESLKCPNCFDAVAFYVSDKKIDWAMSLRRPFLTYNEPTGDKYKAGMPVLLDFYASNCELSSDGYKVKLSIDGKVERFLHDMRPYYIYGLSRGKHTFRLELVDAQGRIVPGAFNDVQRSFTIK